MAYIHEAVRTMVWGHAVGDALGVPVEFESRKDLAKNPVAEMRGYGSYDVPAGSWSDDTSMTLALMESMARLGRVDYEDIMKNFIRWMDKAEFTPTGVMFDIGRATTQALRKYMHGTEPLLCGGMSDHDNGNGSVMRIAPMTLYFYANRGTDIEAEDMQLVHEVSMLTHGHPRSMMACGIYVQIALQLLDGVELVEAVGKGLKRARVFYESQPLFIGEIPVYSMLWDSERFAEMPEDAIKSSGYVVDTLEAVLWCLLNTKNYRECVLKAVNLGEDTDTIAAIAGGLAGLAYGFESIPREWRDALQRGEFIEDLCGKFASRIKQ